MSFQWNSLSCSSIGFLHVFFMRCLLPATVSRSRGPTRRLGILLRSCQSFAFAKRLVTRRRLAGVGNCYEQHRRVPALLLHDHEAILVFVVQQLRLVLGTRDHFMIISCQAAKYEISGGNHDCRHFLSPLKLPLTSTAWCLASSCFIISS